MNKADWLTIITGGPGAGKTRALVEEYIALPIEAQRRAVLLTATPAAASDLSVWIRTTHPDRPQPRVVSFPQFPGFILQLLRGHNVPKPLDETERRWLLARLITKGTEQTWAKNADALAEDVAAVIGLCQRYGVGPGEFETYADTSRSQRDAMQRLATLYRG